MTAPDTSTAPTVPPVIGKRCRLRNGRITQPIYACDGDLKSVYVISDGGMTWTVGGGYDENIPIHPLDIIAVLDDAEPEAAKMPEVARVISQRCRVANIILEANDGTISLRIGRGSSTWIDAAEARALLQVLPSLIEIAEGQA